MLSYSENRGVVCGSPIINYIGWHRSKDIGLRASESRSKKVRLEETYVIVSYSYAANNLLTRIHSYRTKPFFHHGRSDYCGDLL